MVTVTAIEAHSVDYGGRNLARGICAIDLMYQGKLIIRAS